MQRRHIVLVALVGVAVFAVLGRSAQSQTASQGLSGRSSLPAATATSKIAFIREPRGGYAGVLYVMNSDGSGQRMLAPAFPDMRWSHDGQKIAFSAWSDNTTWSDNKSDLYVMNADGSGLQMLTSDPEWEGGPTWSPDGRAIAYTAGGGLPPAANAFDIYVINADGSEQRRLTQDRAGQLAWSPVADKIAFVSRRAGNMEIFVINADGSGQRRLTRNAVRDSDPVWSPDGRRIAFESNSQVYVMNADGSGQRRLTRNGARNFAPAWSPDGQRIAFERRVGREKYGRCDRCGKAVTFQVYVMNADGSEARMLAQDGAQPVWSPDGQKIAFEKHPHGMAFERQSDIYVMNADGSGQRNLTRTPGAGRRESSPVWSPAQKK